MVQLNAKQREFLKKKIFASFAIVSPNTGLPHNTTVWAHFHESSEKFYVITNKRTAKWRFLRDGDKKVAVNITDPKGWPYISFNGTAKIFFEKDKEDFWEVVEEVISKYNSGEAISDWKKKMVEAPPEAERMLVEIEPENLYSTI